MPRHFLVRLTAFAACVACVACVACARAPMPATSTAALRVAPLFELQSNFWVNLHQFLYMTARARQGLDAARPSTRDALADTNGYRALTPGQRAGFESAVAYYAASLSKRSLLFDSTLVAQNWRLSHATNALSLRGSGVDGALAAELERAAPAYRVLWWPRHDAANRRWIANLLPLLDSRADSAARWQAARYSTRWPASIRTDVTAYADWAGGYTITEPGHITISSTNAGNAGLYAFETLFHEASHTLDAALADSLQAAFRAAGKRWPRDPTHPIIFYTAGEITRRVVSPDHVPYAEQYGLWKNPDYARMRPLLEKFWQPYLDGTLSLHDALYGIAAGW